MVSLVSLYLLQLRSYTVYCSSVHGLPESQEMWIQRCRSDNPMFMFWAAIMDLELLVCRFIRSLREGDFPLYVQVCDELCSWFHVMDHTNYARWLPVPVHVRDMVQLSQKHPQLHAEFLGVTLLCRGQLTSSAWLARTSPMNSPTRTSRLMVALLACTRIQRSSLSSC